MIFHVQVFVLFPVQRAELAEPPGSHILTERFTELGRGAVRIAQAGHEFLLVGALWEGEQVDATHVHGRLPGFQVQETGVNDVDSAHGTHSSLSVCGQEMRQCIDERRRSVDRIRSVDR